MSDLILNNLMLMLMLTLMLAFATTWTTSKPSLRTRSSSPYHYFHHFAPPLPADETTAAGKDLKWCTQGHVPDSQTKLQLRL